MGLNDAISAVLEKVGLKKSDIEKCREAISVHEDRIKDLNDELSDKLAEARGLERSLRDLKARYDEATPASRKLLEAQIRSLMRDFSGLKEMLDIVLRNLDKEKLLLRNRRIELEHLRHPTDIDSIVDAQDRKDEIVSDLEEEDTEVSVLEERVYIRKEGDSISAAEPMPGEGQPDALGREIDALLGAVQPESDGVHGASARTEPPSPVEA